VTAAAVFAAYKPWCETRKPAKRFAAFDLLPELAWGGGSTGRSLIDPILAGFPTSSVDRLDQSGFGGRRGRPIYRRARTGCLRRVPRCLRAVPRRLRRVPRCLRAVPRCLRAVPRRLRAVPRCLRGEPRRRPIAGHRLAGPGQKFRRNESRCLGGVHGDVALGVSAPCVARTRVTDRVAGVTQVDCLGTEQCALGRQRSAGAVGHVAEGSDRGDVVRVLEW
jgi:hypothetical protein